MILLFMGPMLSTSNTTHNFCSSFTSFSSFSAFSSSKGAKFGRTVLVLNNIAACHIVLGNYAEADRCLEEAFEDGKDSAETYINAIVSAQLQNKEASAISELVAKLKKMDPNHPWMQETARKENEFDEASAQFS